MGALSKAELLQVWSHFLPYFGRQSQGCAALASQLLENYFWTIGVGPVTAPLIHETLMDQWISLPCWGDCFRATGRSKGDLGLGLDLVIVTPFVVLEFGELSLSDVGCFIIWGR